MAETSDREARERIGVEERSSCSSLKMEARVGRLERTSWFICVIEEGSMFICETLREFRTRRVRV